MDKYQRIFWSVIAILFCAIAAVVIVAKGEQQETKQAIVETAGTSLYDTTYLDNWCAGDEQGAIRMVGGWVNSHEDNVYTIEDESGNLWVVRDVDLDEDDFLLLWINNNGTPDYLEDDHVVKTWREAR